MALAIPALSFLEGRKGFMHQQLRPRMGSRSIALFALCAVALSCPSTPVHAQAVSATTATASLAALPDAPLPAIPQAGQQPQPSPSRQTLPKPADQNPQAPAPPSMSDLGFPDTQTRPDPDMQARLDRHTRMLRIHQRLGLITLAPLAGACISSAFAPPNFKKGEDNQTGRDIHVAFGAASVTMYAITASYAIRAPKVSEGPTRGGIKWHKYLIYVHAPGMILTPILGAMAYDQANNGEKVHGAASAHAAVAWTTVAAYGAAIVAVTWPIHVGSLHF